MVERIAEAGGGEGEVSMQKSSKKSEVKSQRSEAKTSVLAVYF
jgi:hypothetical protein